MPNQTVLKSTQSILSHYEIIAENLSAIDSLSSLVIDSKGACTDADDINNIMLVIGKLQREASLANDEIWKITKGGNNE